MRKETHCVPRAGDVLHFQLLHLFGEFLQRGLLTLENAVVRKQGLVEALPGRGLDTAPPLGPGNVFLPFDVQGLIDLLRLQMTLLIVITF